LFTNGLYVWYTARSTYLANQMPLLSTNACNGGGATANSAPPYTNGSYHGNNYRGNGQARIPACCYDNESPSDGDSKATGSIVGHTYQTCESQYSSDNWKRYKYIAYTVSEIYHGIQVTGGGC